MPKYQVITPIEKDNVLYVPKGSTTEKFASSVSHGKTIPIDASGSVELTETEAEHLVRGQVPLYQFKPDPIGADLYREQKAEQERAEAADKAAKESEQFERFQRWQETENARKAAEQEAAKKKALEGQPEPPAEAPVADRAPEVEEPAGAPTIKCEALKDFQLKGEKYRQGQPLELTYDEIQRQGREKVKVTDVEAYKAAKAEKKK